MPYTAKYFGQQTDFLIRPRDRLCTKTLVNHLLSVCCPMYGFVFRACIFLKRYFFFNEFSFRSDISLNRLWTNAQQTVVRNILQPFVHKCSDDDLRTNVQVHKEEHSSSDTWTANRQETGSKWTFHFTIQDSIE